MSTRSTATKVEVTMRAAIPKPRNANCNQVLVVGVRGISKEKLAWTSDCDPREDRGGCRGPKPVPRSNQ